MMDGQQQMAGRTAARVKPYGLQHESILRRQPFRGSLCFFLYSPPADIIIKSRDADYLQARFNTHSTLRLDFQFPLLPASLCASETQAQRIVMIEYGLQSARKILALQIGRDLQHNRLAKAIQRATRLQKPTHDRSGRHCAYSNIGYSNRCIWRAGNACESFNRRLLKNIAQADDQPCFPRATDQLKCQNAVPAQSEEIIVRRGVWNAEHLHHEGTEDFFRMGARGTP